MTDKIKYVEHPLSAEDKAELRKQGYKILDKAFEPKKAKNEKAADKQADAAK